MRDSESLYVMCKSYKTLRICTEEKFWKYDNVEKFYENILFFKNKMLKNSIRMKNQSRSLNNALWYSKGQETGAKVF